MFVFGWECDFNSVVITVSWRLFPMLPKKGKSGQRSKLMRREAWATP